MTKGLGIALLALAGAIALTEAGWLGTEGYGDYGAKGLYPQGYGGKLSKFYYDVVHGPKLNGLNFLYRGNNYKLNCNANVWYKSVYNCYRGGQRHAFGPCFDRLGKYYSTVKGGYGWGDGNNKYGYDNYGLTEGKLYGSSEGNGVYEIKGSGKYYDYYKTHSGPTLYNGNTFAYNGKNYYLNSGITASKWYYYYDSCYKRYNNCGQCISSLRLYYKNKGGYGEYRKYSGVYSNLKGYGYYTNNFGPKYLGRRLLYRGNYYTLNCGGQKWVSRYDSCYRKYKSFGRCMFNLRGLYSGYKKGIFGGLSTGDHGK